MVRPGAMAARRWPERLGLGLGELLRAGSDANPAYAAPPDPTLVRGLDGATFGRAKNIIFLWLQGGPPQHETFDPKPDAPAEIRGPFRPIATNVPGIHFCELLPRTAALADKLAVVRSISTDDDNHDVSGYWVLTGYPYGPGSAAQIKPTDWPYFGSVVKMLKPSERCRRLTSVWIPDVMRLNDNVTPAGQTAGFLGRVWEPERFVGDPAAPDYQIEGLDLPAELPPAALEPPPRSARPGRRTLPGRRARRRRRGAGAAVARTPSTWCTSGRARAAFDLRREPDGDARPLRPLPLGPVGPAGPPADRGRACGWSTSTGRASRAIRRSTTRCGTRTPRTPTACRTSSVRSSTSPSPP